MLILRSSSTFTVPKGVKKIDVFCVGGGASGGGGLGSAFADGDSNQSRGSSGGGGGGGYTSTKLGVSVTPGQQLSVVVGSGGISTDMHYDAKAGGASSVGEICNANGGAGHSYYKGGNGGSGGGFGEYYYSFTFGGSKGWEEIMGPTNGGQDGNDTSASYKSFSNNYGVSSSDSGTFTAKGQGTTTRYFGESNGTLYAGGGGGGRGKWGNNIVAVGGAGGGGNGGTTLANTGDGYIGSAGDANTGGGGGGGSFTTYSDGDTWNAGGSGGSGICIIRWSGK